MALPGQKWYYNSNSGAVEAHYPLTFFEIHLGIGWHGPFDTKQQALDFYTANAPNNPGWVAPTGLKQQIQNIPNTLGNELGNAGSAALGGVASDVMKVVVRGAEIALGIVLLAIAANAVIKQTTGVDVGRTARRTAVKTAAAATVL